MTGTAILVEMKSVSDTAYALLSMKQNLQAQIEAIFKAIKAEEQRIQEVVECREAELKSCLAELGSCQASLSDCLACRDKDGNPPPCSSEQAAVAAARRRFDEAQRALDAANNHQKRFCDQMNDYCSRIRQFQDQTTQRIDTARSYLEVVRAKVHEYFGNWADNLSDSEYMDAIEKMGWGDHDKAYREATVRMDQVTAAGEFDNVPPHIVSHYQRQISEGGPYKTPHRRQHGHRSGFAGIDLWDVMDYQTTRQNLTQLHNAQRMGLHRRFF